MVTLEQHNAGTTARSLRLSPSQEPRRNGIECPDCNAELYDSTPLVVLASMPPQYNIHCDECSYRGYRY